jgi:hypothetical protein
LDVKVNARKLEYFSIGKVGREVIEAALAEARKVLTPTTDL